MGLGHRTIVVFVVVAAALFAARDSAAQIPGYGEVNFALGAVEQARLELVLADERLEKTHEHLERIRCLGDSVIAHRTYLVRVGAVTDLVHRLVIGVEAHVAADLRGRLVCAVAEMGAVGGMADAVQLTLDTAKDPQLDTAVKLRMMWLAHVQLQRASVNGAEGLEALIRVAKQMLALPRN